MRDRANVPLERSIARSDPERQARQPLGDSYLRNSQHKLKARNEVNNVVDDGPFRLTCVNKRFHSI